MLNEIGFHFEHNDRDHYFRVVVPSQAALESHQRAVDRATTVVYLSGFDGSLIKYQNETVSGTMAANALDAEPFYRFAVLHDLPNFMDQLHRFGILEEAPPQSEEEFSALSDTRQSVFLRTASRDELKAAFGIERYVEIGNDLRKAVADFMSNASDAQFWDHSAPGKFLLLHHIFKYSGFLEDDGSETGIRDALQLIKDEAGANGWNPNKPTRQLTTHIVGKLKLDIDLG